MAFGRWLGKFSKSKTVARFVSVVNFHRSPIELLKMTTHVSESNASAVV
jgi:hypothetical protein